jgi:hypothetical protein
MQGILSTESHRTGTILGTNMIKTFIYKDLADGQVLLIERDYSKKQERIIYDNHSVSKFKKDIWIDWPYNTLEEDRENGGFVIKQIYKRDLEEFLFLESI